MTSSLEDLSIFIDLSLTFLITYLCIRWKTGEYTYLHDYYDEKTLDPEVLSKSIRVYIIFSNLRTYAPIQYEKYDHIRQFTRQLIRVIEELKRSDIGHGHLGKLLVDHVQLFTTLFSDAAYISKSRRAWYQSVWSWSSTTRKKSLWSGILDSWQWRRFLGQKQRFREYGIYFKVRPRRQYNLIYIVINII